MSPIKVKSLVFDFPASVSAKRYDRWQHTTTDWTARHGKKAVDVVAVEPVSAPTTTWLIEGKDFRVITKPPKPCNLSGLPQAVAKKMGDTLLGLADAAAYGQVLAEKSHATLALATASRRVVLHLETHPPTGNHTKLFPTNFAASVFQIFKSLVAHIDTNPLVLNIANTPLARVPWTVQ